MNRPPITEQNDTSTHNSSPEINNTSNHQNDEINNQNTHHDLQAEHTLAFTSRGRCAVLQPPPSKIHNAVSGGAV